MKKILSFKEEQTPLSDSLPENTNCSLLSANSSSATATNSRKKDWAAWIETPVVSIRIAAGKIRQLQNDLWTPPSAA